MEEEKKVELNVEIIKLNQIDDYLKFVEYQRELLVLLTIHKDEQEVALKRLERIKTVAEQVARLKTLNKFQVKGDSREEVLKAIKPYAVNWR